MSDEITREAFDWVKDCCGTEAEKILESMRQETAFHVAKDLQKHAKFNVFCGTNAPSIYVWISEYDFAFLELSLEGLLDELVADYRDLGHKDDQAQANSVADKLREYADLIDYRKRIDVRAA